MLHIVLFEPEIPPNTGNIIRLCANTGAQLHLVKPLGFALDDKQLKRAGLDYHEFATLKVYENWAECKTALQGKRMFALTTKASQCYSKVQFQTEDVLILGPETRGLPEAVRKEFPPQHCIRLPMLAQSRSLNLSNTAAIVLYEAWRQIGFTGAHG